MISLILVVISLYLSWFYKSFVDWKIPCWLENADCFVYASLAEVALEFICLIVYLGVMK